MASRKATSRSLTPPKTRGDDTRWGKQAPRHERKTAGLKSRYYKSRAGDGFMLDGFTVQGRAELAGGEGVEGAEAGGEFGGGGFPFLGVAFHATGDQVAVGIAPRPRLRHDVIQALDRPWSALVSLSKHRTYICLDKLLICGILVFLFRHDYAPSPCGLLRFFRGPSSI